MKKRILAFLLVFIVALGYSASAASSYKSYVYDNNGEAFEAPDAFYFDNKIDLLNLKDDKGKAVGMMYPKDMFVSKDGLIYISGDDENEQGMLLILNSDFTFNKKIVRFKHTVKLENGKTKTINDRFGSVTSTFVDKNDGSIYICDMTGATVDNTDYNVAENLYEEGSGRLIKLDKNFNEQYVVAGIKNEILPDDFNFMPKKVVVDNYGRIFILSQGCTMGILELDSNGEFVQTLGAPAVTYNAFELLWRAISSDAAKENMEDFVPTEYSGIEIDDEGFIFVTNNTFDKTTYDEIQCVSRLNAKGSDVLKTVDEEALPYGDTDASWRATLEGASKLVDIKALDYGNYAVLDSLRGKVFFYNTEGVNLFEFGTVEDDPDDDHVTFIEGNLDVPVALEWLNNQCLVLDSELRCLNTYSMTAYAEKIIEASKLHELDLYDDEIEVWKEVLKLNNNSVAAKQNIGKVYYRDGDYSTAMKYFREIKDQENYSKAFKYLRQQYINDYFTIAIVVIVALIIVWILFKKWRKKNKKERNKEGTYSAQLGFAKTLIFRPLNGAWVLTRENKGSVKAATTILLAVSFMSLLQARFTGFIFDADAEDANILAEFAKICLPVLLFTICNWAVTSLMSGEGSLKAIYMSTCYSLTPILFLYPVAILLSNVMVLEEGDFYSTFITIALIWVFLLIFLGNMRIHDYTLGMAVVELVITVVVILLIVFLAVLFFALIQQMASFVGNVIEEISTR
ncbi:MAG: hypothetical protein U0L17_01040 [Acutalibacteraceae bacterium]|nr:hypothetical protein [Acutalibacteraceae bacterium]